MMVKELILNLLQFGVTFGLVTLFKTIFWYSE